MLNSSTNCRPIGRTETETKEGLILSVVWGIYARVSDPSQALDGLSIQAQLSQLREFFRQRGIGVREYVDAGRSAWTEDLSKRPSFKNLLDDVRAGLLEGVGVTHLDRFSRKLIVTLQVLGEFGQRGVGFVSLENSAFDFSKPADRLLMAVLGAFAEYYSAELSRKIQRGVNKRAAKGLHVGTLPFGYCDGKCPGCDGSCERAGKIGKDEPPVIHPDDAPGVPLAFRTYQLGTQTDETVASALNAAGYRSRTRKGRALWNKHSIAWLLTNAFYAGKVVIKGREFKGNHEALISQELFNEVQEIRRKHYRGASTFTPKHRVYLFAGIMICSGCGRKMRSQTYGEHSLNLRGYRCTAVESKKVECTKPQGPIRADLLECQFGEIVKQFRLPSDWRERVKLLILQNGERKSVECERQSLQQKRERLKWLYSEGDLSAADYTREKRAIESKLATLIIPEEREVLDAGSYLENMAAIWEEATMVERREMVFAMINQVVCDPETKRIVALQPKQAFVPLFRQASNLRERNGMFEIAD